jgi:hypothetical protein
MDSLTRLIHAIFEMLGLVKVPNDVKYILFGLFMSVPFTLLQRYFCKNKKKRGIDDSDEEFGDSESPGKKNE